MFKFVLVMYFNFLLTNGYRLMVDRSSSKRCAPIRIRLAVYIIYLILRVNNLIGKGLSCRESTCRIVAGLTRVSY